MTPPDQTNQADQAIESHPPGWKVGPFYLFTRLGDLEGVTWALLLFGMFLKYVPETTELGVRIFGMLHGVVFISYCLVAILVAIDSRWSLGRLLLSLVAAVVPFLTVWVSFRAQRQGWIGHTWRLRTESPTGLPERLAVPVVRHPLAGIGLGIVAVAALTAIALLVGPPGK